MPWKRHYFKAQKVWVKVDDDDQPVVEDGRVPMRYSDDEDAKIYRASPRNISTSSPAADAGDDGASPVDLPDRLRAVDEVRDADGELLESHTVPDELCDVEEPPDGIVEIHTDGACSGNPGPCGYGVVSRHGFHYRELSQFLGRGTNNIAELVAIKVALAAVEDPTRPVRLYTDSRYCIGVLTKDWKVRANRQLVGSIKQMIDRFDDLEIRKIEGHAGEPLNERADTLATGAVARAD